MFITKIIFGYIKDHFLSFEQLRLENAALRSQLAVFQEQLLNKKIPKPRCNNAFRLLWIFLSKHCTDWKSVLVIFQPDTVLRWHRRAFREYWQHKSRGGRPKISCATIEIIKRIHKENPTLSPEKIYERLVDLNVLDVPCPNTIAKYIKPVKPEPSPKQRQSWQTFLSNHIYCLWSMDMAVVSTLSFKPIYVLVIVSHFRRKIEHFAVTEHPTAQWIIQQIREATAFGNQPRYLIHDNGQPFVDKHFQQFLLNCGIKVKRIAYRSPWQNSICERLIGTLRRDLFDYIIPLSPRHLEKLMFEYVKYYNNVRTHQFLDGETPVLRDKPPLTAVKNTTLKSQSILGGLYHDYDKVA